MQPQNLVSPNQNSQVSAPAQPTDSFGTFLTYWRQHLILAGLIAFFILGPIGLIIAIIFAVDTARQNKKALQNPDQPRSVAARVFSVIAKVCIGSLLALGAIMAFFYLLIGGLFLLSGGQGS